jgi:hypothetical protein
MSYLEVDDDDDDDDDDDTKIRTFIILTIGTSLITNKTIARGGSS